MPVTRSKSQAGGKKLSRKSAPAAMPDISDDSDASSDLSSLDSDFDDAEVLPQTSNKRRKTDHVSARSEKAAADDDTRILVLKADLARAQIRGLINSLPEIEARAYLALLDDPPKEEEPAPFGFVWDDLPPEVKNMIYRLLLVKDTPVKPNITWPNVPDKRSIDKCGLGAHFLRCSKAIYQEGRSILRAENVFDIGPHFKVCMGAGSQKSQNANLMVKARVCSCRFSYNVLRGLRSLANLKELHISPQASGIEYTTKENAEQAAALAWRNKHYRLRHALMRLRQGGKLEKVFFVVERELTRTGGDFRHPGNYIAFRFQVTPNLRPGVHNKKIDGEENLWYVDGDDLEVVGRNEYKRRYFYLDPYPQV